jgi:hypothetical protein
VTRSRSEGERRIALQNAIRAAMAALRHPDGGFEPVILVEFSASLIGTLAMALGISELQALEAVRHTITTTPLEVVPVVPSSPRGVA